MARRIIVAAGARPGVSFVLRSSGTGKQSLDRRLVGLNAGAAFGNMVLVLRDLDLDAACAPDLVSRLLPTRHPRLLLRICVREVEAWLMADHRAYARYCGMRASHLPLAPETLGDPKRELLHWATSGSAPLLQRHLADTRARGIPDWCGLGEWHAAFAEAAWNPVRAAASSRAPSLTRAIDRLRSAIRSE